MNVTERVIVEQFPFWGEAATMTLPTVAAETIVVVGCGTSYYLAQTIASAINLHGRKALAVPGGEWARRPQAYLADRTDVAVIALSRSGESTETVQALEASRAAGLPTFGITCVADSSVAKAAETVIYIPTHADEGIVMTVSASIMLLAGLRMAGVTIAADAAATAEQLLATADKVLAASIKGRKHFVYLGAGPFYGLGWEGALKLQEMSLSYSQAFHPMEYRHGPISLVDDSTFAVFFYSPETADEEAKVAREMQDKGAFVLGFGGPGDVSFEVSGSPEQRALTILPALQILGERVAEGKGINTEAPRHLSKVVVLA